MSVLTSRPALRWVVPLAIVAVALTANVAGRALSADADPALPPRSAAQLLVDLQTSAVAGLSGTVVQRADLGLPELPVAPGGQGSSDISALVSGTHTLRVWYAGEDRQRVAVLGTLGESDVVRNGNDVWTWSSQTNEATHLQLSPSSEPDQPVPTDLPTTPQEAADAALSGIEPTTEVSTDGTAIVAGRSAYELVLAPKDHASLIGQVRIAIDAEEKVPLRVRVFATGATSPALEIGFSQISFEIPADEQFDFQPPPGATVTEAGPEEVPVDATELVEPVLVGNGWTAVLVATAPSPPPADTGSELHAILGALPPVSGPWGSGRLLTSDLFSVLLTDDGRLLIGAVSPEQLYEVAQG
ncbi:MAG: LolA family protein [Geodermatophilaceae bacterium]